MFMLFKFNSKGYMCIRMLFMSKCFIGYCCFTV